MPHYNNLTNSTDEINSLGSNQTDENMNDGNILILKRKLDICRSVEPPAEPPAKRTPRRLGIYAGAKEIGKIAKNLNLSQHIVDYAHAIYRKVYVKRRDHGSELLTDARASTALYLSCYCLRRNIKLSRLREATRAEGTSIKKSIFHNIPKMKDHVQAIKNGDRLPRICGWMILPPEVEAEAAHRMGIMRTLVRPTKKHKFSIKALTATSIYMVLQQRIEMQRVYTLNDISEAFSLTPREILSCYNQFKKSVRY